VLSSGWWSKQRTGVFAADRYVILHADFLVVGAHLKLGDLSRRQSIGSSSVAFQNLVTWLCRASRVVGIVPG
jgi:hypothetical protein